jgi:ribosomal protein S18 acetylase RimI-like enzyme
MDSLLISDIQHYIIAFIQSFEAAYDSSHSEIKGTKFFYYGAEFSNSPFEVVPYQSIVFNIDQPAEEIDSVVHSYRFPGDGSFAIQVFHENMDPQIYKLRYQPLGYQYFLPNILQVIELPAHNEIPEVKVDPVSESSQVDFINASFSNFKPFPLKLLQSDSCSSFFVEIDKKAAGWGYLVHTDPKIAYVGGMFTAPDFRKRGVASAILNRMHQFAFDKGIKKIMLVPSFMAWNFYARRGYQTIAHFSTFIPSEEWASSRR